jgi:hypothetical protein
MPDHVRRPRAVPVAVSLVVVLALLVGACTRRSASDLAGPSGTAHTGSTTTLVDAPPGSDERVLVERSGDPEFDAVMDELARFVEDERGLEFKQSVRVDLLDDAAFEQRILDDFDSEEIDDLVTAGRVLQALGLIPPGTDLVRSLRDLLGAGVLGFYDPETDELVVRGADLTLYTRQTIVHELVHALDDQWFDLDRSQYDERDDEIGFGFTSLVEGNAVRIEDAWTTTLSSEDQRELRREELSFGAGVVIDVPFVVFDLVLAPYEIGPVFVDALLAEGGQALVDGAFEDPPTTSAQVLHPDLYRLGVEPVAVGDPPAEGTIIDEGVVGEFFLGLLLGSVLDTTTAERAACGWVGDRYVAWEQGAGVCLRADFAMDTPEDLTGLGAALERWGAAQGSATVDRIADDRLRFTSCG